MATTTSTASPLRLGIIGSGGIGAIHADVSAPSPQWLERLTDRLRSEPAIHDRRFAIRERP